MNERHLFEAALDLPPADRARFLDDACGDDAGFRHRLDELLQKHADAGSFLETSPVVPDPVSTEAAGTVLAGRYKLLEPIGEGGMGSVWMAQQTSPVRRLVAVKLIKAGMDTKAVLVRFEAERQALALMDHPNIARVLDAGTTSEGRPFFVMELVKGVPVTRYCDEQRLTLRQRLALFVPVCQAIQHAHTKGVIHRDVKPTNVLVTRYDETPVPKVIDFGVAKAAGQPLTEQTLQTGFGAVVGTVEYMSPEQAAFNALDVDTRSDVYSLGVLLYELLTGSPPFPRSQAGGGVLDLLRVIREQEPTRPSTKLRKEEGGRMKDEQRRSVSSFILHPSSFQELDWIVMKALEKDRSRRYETANDFALDVGRYLADEPVAAGPPSAGYRLRKFASRHRQAVAAACAAVALLVVGVVALAAALVVVEREKGRTQDALTAEAKRRKQARDALDAMTSRVVEDWLARQAALLPEHEQFLRQALRYYEEFAADTGTDAESRAGVADAHHRVGLIRETLGQAAEAEAAWRRAIELYAALDATPEYQLRLARVHRHLGALLHTNGRTADAEPALGEAQAILRRLTADHPDREEAWKELATCASGLAVLYRSTARPKPAEAAHGEAIAIHRRLAEAHPANPDYRLALAWSYNNLGSTFQNTRQPPRAEAPYREALALSRQLLADVPGNLDYQEQFGVAAANLALTLKDLDRLPEAEALFAEALAVRRRHAADYPNVPRFRQHLARTFNDLGFTLRAMDKLDAAEDALKQGLALHRQLVREFPDRPDYRSDAAGALVNLGRLLHTRGIYAGARELLEEAEPILRRLLKEYPKHPVYRFFYRNNRWRLAETLVGLKDHAAAADMAGQFLAAATDPPRDAYTAGCLLADCARLAAQDASLGEPERARLRDAYAARAVAALRQAVEQKYKDIGQMRKAAELDPLRSREDFRELLTRLDAKP